MDCLGGMPYVDNVMNSIAISYVSCVDVETTILSLKNNSPSHDECNQYVIELGIFPI